MDYDVVVVGAGPAGSSAGMAAARAGARTLVLEKEATVAQTVRTSGVTWTDSAEEFGIPRDCYHEVGRFGFASPGREVVARAGAARAAVLDVRRAYRWLAGQARAAGAEVRAGAAAEGALVEGGRVAGVRAGGAEIRAGVVVDASGFQSAVCTDAGLAGGWRRFGAGAEYEVEAESVDPGTWWLMVGSAYSPAGYAWIFPLGGRMARVGVGVGKPESAADPRRLLDALLEAGTGPVGRLGRVEVAESHYGLIPNGGARGRTAFDGLLLVGDSAGQANPLVLEGIRYAIRFGRYAGAVAAEAALSGRTGAGHLEKYDRMWRSEAGSRLRAAGRVQERWLGLSDSGWDRELGVIGRLGAGELLGFMRADLGRAGMARLAARHPLLAARLLLGAAR